MMVRDLDGRVGEGWSGAKPNGSHVNVVLAARGSATFAAAVGMFAHPSPGHTPVLVCVGPDEAHYEPGEPIVRQGEIGDRFYIIARGAVEVVREDGDTCTRLARLGPGEHFGEVALLQNVPRTATVRAVEPTDSYVHTPAPPPSRPRVR